MLNDYEFIEILRNKEKSLLNFNNKLIAEKELKQYKIHYNYLINKTIMFNK